MSGLYRVQGTYRLLCFPLDLTLRHPIIQAPFDYFHELILWDELARSGGGMVFAHLQV